HEFAVRLVVAHDVVERRDPEKCCIGRSSSNRFVRRIECNADERAHLWLAEFEALKRGGGRGRTATAEKEHGAEKRNGPQIELNHGDADGSKPRMDTNRHEF